MQYLQTGSTVFHQYWGIHVWTGLHSFIRYWYNRQTFMGKMRLGHSNGYRVETIQNKLNKRTRVLTLLPWEGGLAPGSCLSGYLSRCLSFPEAMLLHRFYKLVCQCCRIVTNN